ncbi:hypothetical protein [Nevskia ramosa]|uniref:hypothetical protein n=1 Tax=Nevskia ramosa TaxID=64002 RepID=UPI003D0CEA0C
MRLDVVNPWGRDAPVDWRGGLTPPGAPGHAPINYWAWAAATGGRFHQTPDTVDGSADAVVVLLRRRGLANLRAVRQLKARGLTVFVSWKESGSAQIEHQLRYPWRRWLHRQVLAACDGAFAATEPGFTHYQEYGLPSERVRFVATPYPFDEPGWDFAQAIDARSGIVVGTRQFDQPSRRHTEALQLAGRIARAAGTPLTVFNLDGEAGRARVLAATGAVPTLRWVEQRLPYPAFLQELARHRLVIQRDAGWVPGQIAGDALLCGIVNIGGNGAVQRLAFPALAEPEADEALLEAAAIHLLSDDDAYRLEIEQARQRAERVGLSYGGFRAELAELLAAMTTGAMTARPRSPARG